MIDKQFGPATVIRETKTGYLILLGSPLDIQVDRPASALNLQDGTAVSDPGTSAAAGGRITTTGATAANTPAGPLDARVQARMAIDALRFGVVPASHLAELTLGHDELEKWVIEHLPRVDESPRASAVYGPFGSGKSHTMAAIREIARERGYLVMATEINGTEISLAQPRALLASLLGHMTSSADLDGAAPLLNLVLAVIHAPGALTVTDRAPLLAATTRSIRSLSTTKRFDDLDDLIERLLGSDPNLNRTDFKSIVRDTLDWDDYRRMTYDRNYSPWPLISHSPVDARPYEFVRALMGYASLAARTGHNGVVVTVDELEVEQALATGSKWQKLTGFVTAMRAEFSESSPPGGGLAVFLAAVEEDDSIEHDVVSLIVGATPGEPYRLQPWGRSYLLDLGRRIHGLYSAGYGLDVLFDEEDASGILEILHRQDLDQSGEIRAFIRSFVARLDLNYGPPLS